MKNKSVAFLFLILLSAMLAACVGPPKDDKCIPSDGTKTGATNSPGPAGSGGFAQQVDDALKNGHIISTIVSDIKTKLVGDQGNFTAAQGIFEAFVQSPDYQMALGAAFSLFVIIYGMSVAVGMVQVSLGDAAIRVAKIGFIAVVAMNWDIFYQTIGSFFINGTDELITYFMSNFQNLYNVPGQTQNYSNSGSGIFSAYDDLIARIFSFQTFAFVSALFHAGIYAPIYAIFLTMSLWWVLQSIMKVIQVYIFSLFAKALLFALAPVFLAFLLFDRTKPMFDAWITQLVSFSLQPVLITAYIGLFANLLMPFFEQYTQYKMCWARLDNTSDKHGWRFVQANSASDDPIDYGSTTAPPISLQAVFLFMFFAWLFKTAINMTDSISQAIVQSSSGNLGDLRGLAAFLRGIDGAGQSSIGNKLTQMPSQMYSKF